MTKRLVWATEMSTFKYFLMTRNVEIDQILDEKVRQQIGDLTTGCFVLAIRIPKGRGIASSGDSDLIEGIVMHKFPKACNMMISRENIFSLHLRYLTKQERESVAQEFELDK